MLSAVPATAERIPDMVDSMVPRGALNCMWTAANLRQVALKVLRALPAIAERVIKELPGIATAGLQMSLMAASRLGLCQKLTAEPDHRGS